MKNKETKITKAQLQTGKISVFMDPAFFDAAEGEHLAGLNTVKLAVGQAAGPFKISRVELNSPIGKPEVVKPGKPEKKQKTVDKYFGYLCDMQGMPVRNQAEFALPIAKAFVMRAADAKLAAGDFIALKRTADYNSGQPQPGQGFEIKVIHRAAALAALTAGKS